MREEVIISDTVVKGGMCCIAALILSIHHPSQYISKMNPTEKNFKMQKWVPHPTLPFSLQRAPVSHCCFPPYVLSHYLLLLRNKPSYKLHVKRQTFPNMFQLLINC